MSGLIDRKEEWYFIKQETAAKGMIYFRSKKKTANKIEDEKAEVKATVSFDDLKNRFGG